MRINKLLLCIFSVAQLVLSVAWAHHQHDQLERNLEELGFNFQEIKASTFIMGS